MKKYLLLTFILFNLTISVSATDYPVSDSLNIIEEGHKQVAQFIKMNERFKREGKLDSLNYTYVYVPGEQFNFYRTVDDKLNVIDLTIEEWVHDANDKLPSTVIEKFNDDLEKFNNQEVPNKGPDGEFGTADDFDELFQHYVVIVDGPKNFLNGKLNTIVNKVELINVGSPASGIQTVNVTDYEAQYDEFRTDFVDDFPTDMLFNSTAHKMVLFAFVNPVLKSVAGQKTGMITSPKVNIHVDLEIKQVNEPIQFAEEFESWDIHQLPTVVISAPANPGISRGLLTFVNYVYSQIFYIHGAVDIEEYTDCESFSTQLYYQYSRDFFEARCTLHTDNSNYQEFIRVSALFLELAAFSAIENDAMPGGGNILDFVVDRIDGYVNSSGFGDPGIQDDHYIIWLIDYYQNTETTALKKNGYARIFYSYFFILDQSSGEEIINQAQAMFDLLNNKGIEFFENIWYWVCPICKKAKVEFTWYDFYTNIKNLTNGAYNNSFRQEMYNLLNANIPILWEYVLKPCPDDLQSIGIPGVGIGSLQMGAAVNNFILQYHSIYNASNLNAVLNSSVEDPTQNYYYITENELYSFWIPIGGIPIVLDGYIGHTYDLDANNNIDLKYCEQLGLPWNSRFNCNGAGTWVNTPLDQSIEKQFFEPIMVVNVQGVQYIECDLNEETTRYEECIFYSALKIENEDFNRHVEQAATVVAIALFPLGIAEVAAASAILRVVYIAGVAADGAFIVESGAGGQTVTTEKLTRMFGPDGAAIYNDYVVPARNIAGFGAGGVALGKMTIDKIGKMGAMRKQINNTTSVNPGVPPSYVNQVDGGAEKLLGKVENDARKALSNGPVDNAIQQELKIFYKIDNSLPDDVIMSAAYVDLRKLMDGVRDNIHRLHPTANAYEVRLVLKELHDEGKLLEFAEELTSSSPAFRAYFNGAETVGEFTARVRTWKHYRLAGLQICV